MTIKNTITSVKQYFLKWHQENYANIHEAFPGTLSSWGNDNYDLDKLVQKQAILGKINNSMDALKTEIEGDFPETNKWTSVHTIKKAEAPNHIGYTIRKNEAINVVEFYLSFTYTGQSNNYFIDISEYVSEMSNPVTFVVTDDDFNNNNATNVLYMKIDADGHIRYIGNPSLNSDYSGYVLFRDI